MDDAILSLIHDARNPLNNISINAELGRLALEAKQDSQKAIETFEVILKECKRCSAILEDLSEYERAGRNDS